MREFQAIERRFSDFLASIQSIPACSSRQEAHDVLLEHWIKTCRKFGLSRQLLATMQHRSLCAEHGWQDLDKDPCFWDSRTAPGVRIYLHRNGQIVMQKTNDAAGNEILFFKTGR